MSLFTNTWITPETENYLKVYGIDRPLGQCRPAPERAAPGLPGGADQSLLALAPRRPRHARTASAKPGQDATLCIACRVLRLGAGMRVIPCGTSGWP